MIEILFVLMCGPQLRITLVTNCKLALPHLSSTHPKNYPFIIP